MLMEPCCPVMSRNSGKGTAQAAEGWLEPTRFDYFPMFPMPDCCWNDTDLKSSRARHQRRKLYMLKGWRDAVERQLAAVNAAIGTLEAQMERDQTNE